MEINGKDDPDVNNWTNDPKLKHFDASKLALLNSLAREGTSKGSSQMLPFFLSVLRSANAKGINFSEEERETLMEVLMQQLSPAERKKAETILRMTSAMKK